MDVDARLKDLHATKGRLKRAIAQLEALVLRASNGTRPNRRGRKSMGPEERKVVSERLKRYWAKLRQRAQ